MLWVLFVNSAYCAAVLHEDVFKLIHFKIHVPLKYSYLCEQNLIQE